MPERDVLLQDFLAALTGALAAARLEPRSAVMCAAIGQALHIPGTAGVTPPQRLAVCDHVATALDLGRAGPVGRLADAFGALEPRLFWRRRPSSVPTASGNWVDGHANAVIVGAGGLEQRDDLYIGVSLLAPHVRYPDHDHPPEETYLLLSPGRFRHGGSDWFAPGIGGTLYNEPGITHAMASDDDPLLAIWCLWMGQ